MYSHFWLMTTLSMGCLLWWLRSRRHTAWLAWVAASLGMIGCHALGLIVLALQPLMLVTCRNIHWRTPLALVAGLGIVAAAPILHFQCFNEWTERIEAQGWNASGLAWIESLNRGRDGLDMLDFTLGQHLFALPRHTPQMQSSEPEGWPDVLRRW